MRLQLMTGSVVAMGLTVAVAACSGSDSITNPANDGQTEDAGRRPGSSGSSGSSGDDAGGTPGPDDAGASSGGDAATGGNVLKPVELKKGAVQLVGIAGDHAVYLEAGAGETIVVNAVPVTGGAATKIAELGANDTMPRVSGGAVAIYKNLTETGLVTLSVWTKAAGLKADLSTTHAAGFFVASDDGSRIAYGTNAVVAGDEVTSTSVVVADVATAAAAAAPALTDVNLVAGSCRPQLGFVVKALLAAYCTGTAADASAARLYAVADGATPTAKRLDAAGNAAGTVQPYWQADKTASKVFVISSDAANQGRIITVGAGAAAPTSATLENDVYDGVLTDDGAYAIYLTTTGKLVRGNGAGAPVTLVEATVGAKSFLAFNADKSRILFHTLDANGDGDVDIKSIDATTGAQTPVSISDDLATPVGFNAPGSQVVYLADWKDTGATAKAKPPTGGTAKDLGKDAFGVVLPTSGTSALLYVNPKVQGETVFFDISVTDSVAGGTPKPLLKSVVYEQTGLKDKTYVYVSADPAATGLYSVTLP